MKPFDRFCLWLAYASAAFLITMNLASCAGVLKAAPAPLAKRASVTALTAGEYDLYWNGFVYRTSLWTDYDYRAVGAGTWEGTANWDSASRVLVIHERPAGSEGGWARYEVVLDGSLEGKTTCGVSVRLRRIK